MPEEETEAPILPTPDDQPQPGGPEVVDDMEVDEESEDQVSDQESVEDDDVFGDTPTENNQQKTLESGEPFYDKCKH